jgi:hypothetical protein
MAHRRGIELQKVRRRDQGAIDYGAYRLLLGKKQSDLMTLEQAEKVVKSPRVLQYKSGVGRLVISKWKGVK